MLRLHLGYSAMLVTVSMVDGSNRRGGQEISLRLPLFLTQLIVFLVLVVPLIAPVFRDNDQAALLSAARQIALGQISPLHAEFYNFDKQWGSYLLLAAVRRTFPHTDPILGGNLLTTLLGAFGWLSLSLKRAGHKPQSLKLLASILFSPVLILYLPYLGTGWLSFAFLLLAFTSLTVLGPRSRWPTAAVMLSIASALRADAILTVPALVISQLPRSSFRRLIIRKPLWLISAAAVLPILLGKWLMGISIPDSNPFSFNPRIFFGFVIFGLTPAVSILLVATFAAYLYLAARNSRFRIFYLLQSLSVTIPLCFYAGQLYTLRYFLSTLAAMLFVLGSRRSTQLWLMLARHFSRRARICSVALATLTALPWLAGLQLPALNRPRLTVLHPTRFPTGDGLFPMGGYVGFQREVLFDDHLQIDHNQKIWQALETVRYRSCSDGTVPYLFTAMSNYLDFSIREQGLTPHMLFDLRDSPCIFAYLDVRSYLHGYRVSNATDKIVNSVEFVSHVSNGELIATVQPGSNESGQLLDQVRNAFGRRSASLFLANPGERISFNTQRGLDYLLFCDGTIKQWTARGSEKIDSVCSGRLNGWAHTESPAYMGAGSSY